MSGQDQWLIPCGLRNEQLKNNSEKNEESVARPAVAKLCCMLALPGGLS